MEPKVMPKEKVPAPKQISATIVVSLPADARLTIDGNTTTSTSELRTFTTPALQTGEVYVYTMQAEVVHDGASTVQTREVTVRGGETVNVPFTFTQTVASR